jgi:hypothetical protein
MTANILLYLDDFLFGGDALSRNTGNISRCLQIRLEAGGKVMLRLNNINLDKSPELIQPPKIDDNIVCVKLIPDISSVYFLFDHSNSPVFVFLIVCLLSFACYCLFVISFVSKLEVRLC